MIAPDQEVLVCDATQPESPPPWNLGSDRPNGVGRNEGDRFGSLDVAEGTENDHMMLPWPRRWSGI